MCRSILGSSTWEHCVTLLVYIAGPYTGDGSPEAAERNVRAAIDAQAQLLDAGVLAIVPHLSHYAHAVCPRSYEAWMTLDLALVDRCDAVLRLPGESRGADDEVLRAQEDGTMVLYSVEDVIAWAPQTAARGRR